MVEFESTAPGVTEEPSGKKTVDYFASVRERGMLNAGLDSLAKMYEDSHPGMACRWENFRPGESGGSDMVSFREGQGFRAVKQSDLGAAPVEGSIVPDTGSVRRGDLVLMAGPRELVNQIRLQDAEAAQADLKAPQRAYEESVKSHQVKTGDGQMQSATPFGKIEQRSEEIAKVGEAAG